MSSVASSSEREERQFILECIEVYKTLPALRDIQSKEYSNRQKKNDAYHILVEKYRERNPKAEREDVKIFTSYQLQKTGEKIQRKVVLIQMMSLS
jgi:hypothetical protein